MSNISGVQINHDEALTTYEAQNNRFYIVQVAEHTLAEDITNLAIEEITSKSNLNKSP